MKQLAISQLLGAPKGRVWAETQKQKLAISQVLGILPWRVRAEQQWQKAGDLGATCRSNKTCHCGSARTRLVTTPSS